VPMSLVRQRVGERLKNHQAEFVAKYGIRLGLMPIFVKASCRTFQDQPAVSAQMEGKEIVFKNYSDLAITVPSPTGLAVSVIRNADVMSMVEIEKQLMFYASNAKDRSPALEGGTFISNKGVLIV